MTDFIKVAKPNTVEAEAADWIARLDRGGLSKDECHALREWVERSPEHYALLNRFASIWQDLDGLADILEETEPPVTVNDMERKQRRLTLFPGAAITAVIFAVVIGIFIVNNDYFRPVSLGGQPAQVSYLTAIGEQRTVTLQDGSRTQLNTDTEINVDFDDQYRRVHLVKGEALFEIAPKASWPFLVYAGTNVIHVVSTAFVVKMIEDQVEVTIKEGRVELKSFHGGTWNEHDNNMSLFSTVVNTSQTAIIDRRKHVLKHNTKEEIERKLAWREGLIIFSGEPLNRVVEEISRYIPVKFVITDPELNGVRIGGIFRIGDTAAMLDILETGFDVNISRSGNNLVYLSRGFQE